MAIVSEPKKKAMFSKLAESMLLPMGKPTVSRHERAVNMIKFLADAYATTKDIAVIWDNGTVVRGTVHAYKYNIDALGQPECEFILKTGELFGFDSMTLRGTWIRIYGFDLKEPSIDD